MYIGALMPVYCFSLFSPTLVANLGYVAATAQLLCKFPALKCIFPCLMLSIKPYLPSQLLLNLITIFANVATSVLAAITTVVAGFLSDRSQKRGIYVLIFSVIGMLGFILCIAAPADTRTSAHKLANLV